MARVSTETLSKLQGFIDSLPDEQKNKCAICKETLTHIVKTGEAQTGAPRQTVSRALTDAYNENALPGDKVSPRSFERKMEGIDNTINPPKRGNKTTSTTQRTQETIKHETKAMARKKAIKLIGISHLCSLNEYGDWPDDIISWIKRTLSKQYHPDSGGTDDKYKKFNEALQILGGLDE